MTVRTEFDSKARTVSVLVEDNGEGIAPEDLTRIFSVFESRKGNRGTGLGLPVSQKIMHEHDGDITVESAPDRGSRFRLHMPAVIAEERTAAQNAELADPRITSLPSPGTRDDVR